MLKITEEDYILAGTLQELIKEDSALMLFKGRLGNLDVPILASVGLNEPHKPVAILITEEIFNKLELPDKLGLLPNKQTENEN